MYKALHVGTGEEIIILSPQWNNQISRLREMDHQDLLICQGCRQPLRVKSGEMKRAHFAHKHLQACSFGKESLEILIARAVLYQWLEKQFGDKVTLEKVMLGLDIPRPVDCWLEMDGSPHAYWLFETGIKLEVREALLAAFEQASVPVHWIFLQQMLTEEKKEFNSLLLTPTERAFLQKSPLDEIEAGINEAGSSCQYLDSEKKTFTTFRNLTIIHRPNWFQGIKRVSNFENARINRENGEIIHPGELDRLSKFKRRQQRIANKLASFQGKEEEWGRHLVRQEPQHDHFNSSSVRHPIEDRTPELPCIECGQYTTDYWSSFIGDRGFRVCRCRECLDRSTKENQQ